MAAKSYKMFVDGKWVDASGGETFEDMNPYTGEVYANVAAGRAEDVRRAVDAAQAAFPEWAATPPAAKRKIFLEAAAC
jgi:acyl-CoA reductase-like NAD-dependent aldehyde dehydrogenase